MEEVKDKVLPVSAFSALLEGGEAAAPAKAATAVAAVEDDEDGDAPF
jgi:hypothetical protein